MGKDELQAGPELDALVAEKVMGIIYVTTSEELSEDLRG